MLATVPPIKTPLGQQELRRRTGGLGQRHRTLLFLIDGRRPLSEVLMLGHKAGAATSHLEDLIRLGFVDVPALHPADLPPVSAPPEVSAQVTYVEMEIPEGPVPSQWGTLDAEVPVPVVKVFDEPVLSLPEPEVEEAVASEQASEAIEAVEAEVPAAHAVEVAPSEPDSVSVSYDATVEVNGAQLAETTEPTPLGAQTEEVAAEAAAEVTAEVIEVTAAVGAPIVAQKVIEPAPEPSASHDLAAMALGPTEVPAAEVSSPSPEPVAQQPVTHQPVTHQPVTHQPVVQHPAATEPAAKTQRVASALLPLDFPPEPAFTSTPPASTIAPPAPAVAAPAPSERRPLPAVLQRMAMLTRRPPVRPKDPVDEARDCLLRVIKLDRTTMARRLRPRVVNAKTEGTLIDVVWELERDLTHGQRSHEGLIALQRARELLQLGNTLVDEAIDVSGMLHG